MRVVGVRGRERFVGESWLGVTWVGVGGWGLGEIFFWWGWGLVCGGKFSLKNALENKWSPTCTYLVHLGKYPLDDHISTNTWNQQTNSCSLESSQCRLHITRSSKMPCVYGYTTKCANMIFTHFWHHAHSTTIIK